MRNPLNVTLLIVLTAAAFLLGYDLCLCLRDGSEASISWNLYRLACDNPLVPLLIGFFVGLLFGHLFWPNCR